MENSTKQNCCLNEKIIGECKNLYRGSNLGVVDYLESVLPRDRKVKKFANQYREETSCGCPEDDDGVDTFWEMMWYLGLNSYLD